MSLVRTDLQEGFVESHPLVLREFYRFMSQKEQEHFREDASLLLLDHLQDSRAKPRLLEYQTLYQKWHLHIVSLKEQHGAQGNFLTALLEFVGLNEEASSDTVVDDESKSVFTDVDTCVEVPATEKLVDYFQGHLELVRLASELFKMDSKASTEKRFSNLLILYARGLRTAAKTDLETKASEWVERKKYPITAAFYRTIDKPNIKGPSLVELLPKEPHSGPVLLERFLGCTDETTADIVPQLPNLPAGGQESVDNHGKKDGEQDDEPPEVLTGHDEGPDFILDSMKDFIISSPAFSQLLENLQKVVTSVSQSQGKAPVSVIPNAQKTNSTRRQVIGTWTCVSKFMRFFWTLM